MQIAPVTSRLQRIRHELRLREVTVTQAVRISPGFIAVTFADPSLRDFPSASFSDHVKLILPDVGGGPVRRDYTPRSFQLARGELTIEFALHESGPASDWARQARPGQKITVGGPKGSVLVPLDYDWHLLAGDATALPAMHRRLEELPRSARGVVVLQVADPADQRAFPCGPGIAVVWVTTGAAFLAALRGLDLPEGNGFAWCAGETGLMMEARAILLGTHRLAREQVRVSGYWKRGLVAVHEKFED